MSESLSLIARNWSFSIDGDSLAVLVRRNFGVDDGLPRDIETESLLAVRAVLLGKLRLEYEDVIELANAIVASTEVGV